MKKTLVTAAFAALAMVSCTKDQVIEVKHDAINFSVTANGATKSANLFNSVELMPQFNVWAEYTEDGTIWEKYFGDQAILGTKKVSNGSVSYTWAPEGGVERYWPELSATKNIRFYAIAGDDVDIMDDANSAWCGSGDRPIIYNYTVDEDVTKQKDLLYSISSTLKAKPSNETVALNFRHALSRIEFRARNEAAGLWVEIKEIAVCNVAGKGTFLFPDDVSKPTISGTGGADKGTWILEKNNPTDYYYKYHTNYKVVFPQSKGIWGINDVILTDYNDKLASNIISYDNSLLLLPQTTEKYHRHNSSQGSYLAVKCRIYNCKNGGDPDITTIENEGVQWVRGTDGYYDVNEVLLYEGWTYIPVAFNWEEGKKYVYKFLFQNGGDGGFDGGNETDPDPTPNPSLFSIKYTVTVDDFETTDVIEVPMQSPALSE